MRHKSPQSLPKIAAAIILIFMPIYEYLCKKCGRRFEQRQSVTEAPVAECEKCGGDVEKQWSLSGFQFKGEGWYVTDYSAKKGAKDGDTKEKSSTSESTAASETASKPDSEKKAKTEPVKDKT
ncbi:MAG: FmdB family zinc ribbon protein [Pyrinomonadaceae bacterium]